jgi:predicted transcriptional regulator
LTSILGDVRLGTWKQTQHFHPPPTTHSEHYTMAIEIANNPSATTTTTGRKREQSPTAYLKSICTAKKIGEFFFVPLSSLKILPGFNERINYNLDDLKLFISQNGAAALPPLKLMWVDNDLYVEEGHRRHKACIELNLPDDAQIKVFIGEPSTPAERLARQISSNSGEKYNFIECVAVVKKLIQNEGENQATVAKMIGRTQPAVSQMTKFFGYSRLLMVAINKNEIKYTRVLELQKNGLNEAEILEVVKQSKHAPTASVELTEPVEPTASVELTEPVEPTASVELTEPVEPTASVELTEDEDEDEDEDVDEEDEDEDVDEEDEDVDEEDEDVDEEDEDEDEDENTKSIAQKLEELLGNSPKSAKSAKSAKSSNKSKRFRIKERGVDAGKPNVGETKLKKDNPAKVLAKFFVEAEIFDNGNGTFSYVVTDFEHTKFELACKNL